MTLDSAFEEFLSATVTLEPYASETSARVKTYGASRSVKARVEHFVQKVTDEQGRERVSRTRVFLNPIAIDGTAVYPVVSDRITLPVGNSPRTPEIISVQQQPDVDSSVHHFVVMV